MKIYKTRQILLVLFSISSTIILSTTSNADEYLHDQNSAERNQYIEKNNSVVVTPFILDELRNFSHTLTLKTWLNGEILANQMANNLNPIITSEEGFVLLNNDMKIVSGETLAANQATLDNTETPIDQTLSTPSFEYISSNTVTTQTTHSTGTNLTTSAEMKLPLAQGSMSFSVAYNFSHTNTVSTDETYKWNVPSQSIKVPAGRKYSVNWILNKGVATGTSTLQSKVKGEIPYRKNGFHPIGKAFEEDDRLSNSLTNAGVNYPIFNLRSEWKGDSIDNTVASRNVGTATYTAKYGTQLIMRVVDVTDHKNHAEVFSVPLNVTPLHVQK